MVDGDIRFSDAIHGGGAALFRHAGSGGLEGIVSKRIDAPYRCGRATSWVKVKSPNLRACRFRLGLLLQFSRDALYSGPELLGCDAKLLRLVVQFVLLIDIDARAVLRSLFGLILCHHVSSHTQSFPVETRSSLLFSR